MKIVQCYKIGSFSHMNRSLADAFPAAFPGYEFRWTDLLETFRKRYIPYFLALTESSLRYRRQILTHSFSPIAFVPRTNTFNRWLREEMSRLPAEPDLAFTFQTQSLFDASRRGVPHFLYTDHTHRANQRYAGKGKIIPTSRYWQSVEDGLYRRSRINFTTSEFAARSLVEDYGVSPERARNVRSGINLKFPAEVDPARRQEGRILFVGVEWLRKGGPELFDAFTILSREFPNLRLHVVGCTPDDKAPGLFAHGRIPISEVQEQFAQAQIFCMPSRSEPSASALIEAAAYGLPVITTNVGGTPERVIDGETGILVPPRDTHALMTALRSLLLNPARGVEMGRKGRELAALFDWNAVARGIASGVNSVL